MGCQNPIDLLPKELLEQIQKYVDSKLPLFHEPLEMLEVPILFVGSMEDTMCRGNLEEEYSQMEQLVSNGKTYLFPTGNHPAILSNAENFADIAKDFLLSE